MAAFVEGWLAELKLEKYLSNFVDNGFDDRDVLACLSAEDLDTMQIALAGHRKRLLVASAKLNAGSGDGGAPAPAPAATAEATAPARPPAALPPGAAPQAQARPAAPMPPAASPADDVMFPAQTFGRKEAEEFLANQPPSTFLLRIKDATTYSVSLVAPA